MGLSERREEVRPQLSSEQQEQEEERRKLRRLQVMMNMVMSVISQDQDLTVEEAAELVANTKRAALAMFPGQGVRLRHPLQAAAAAADGGTLPHAVSRLLADAGQVNRQRSPE